MSEKLISHNPDLERLRNEGYEVAIHDGYLAISSVPYVTASRQIALGVIVSDLTLSGERTQRPSDHQVWFVGSQPHTQLGTPIVAIGPREINQPLFDGVVANYRFSNKPKDGYPDYYEKMSRYAEILCNEARAIDSGATAKTFKPIGSLGGNGVFLYTDTATSRSGLTAVARKIANQKVAIIGLGGTGSYVLDLVAKTPVGQIHIFDGDHFYQHNAFRSPGAASLSELEQRPLKVDYYGETYDQMRAGVVRHATFIDDENIDLLTGFDFAFVCVDRPAVRQLIRDHLENHETPFIDTGMDVSLVEDVGLVGSCRVTLSTPAKRDHFGKHVSLEDGEVGHVYGSNIQIAELNMLSASLAVIKWKKHFGFYQDCYREHQTVYVVNTHQLTKDECQ